MLRILSRVGRVALGHSKSVATKLSLFKSGTRSVTARRVLGAAAIGVAFAPYSAFNMPWNKEKDDGQKKFLDAAQKALEAKDWIQTVYLWKKLLAMDLDNEVKQGLFNQQKQTAISLVKSADYQDKLVAASMMKIYLSGVKDDEEAWHIYCAAKVVGLTKQLAQDKNADQLDDYIELQNVASESLKYLKDPVGRSRIEKLIQDPQLKTYFVIQGSKLIKEAADAQRAQNLHRAIECYNKALSLPVSPGFADSDPNIYMFLASAILTLAGQKNNPADFLPAVSVLKKYLAVNKNNDDAWCMLMMAKLESLNWWGDRRNIKPEDYAELKALAADASRYIKNPKKRQAAVEEVLADPKVQSATVRK